MPASRTGYAYVYVNGDDYGVHLNIETLDEVALARPSARSTPHPAPLRGRRRRRVIARAEPTDFEIDEGDEATAATSKR